MICFNDNAEALRLYKLDESYADDDNNNVTTSIVLRFNVLKCYFILPDGMGEDAMGLHYWSWRAIIM
eukprot:SAG11_NODE_1718_length_4382_cov_2.032687_1_plen_67_part_00